MAKKQSKPNVVVIYTDDHRYTGIHALGGEAVMTPAMDALAYDGIVFTNTYLMGAFSGATCVPSRAMLNTGRQLFDLEKQGHHIPTSHTTIGEAFQKAGYHSHIIGKWHQDNKALVRSFNSGNTIMGRDGYLVDHFRMPFWDWGKEDEFSRKYAYLLRYDENGKVVRRPLSKEDVRGPIGTEADGPHSSEVFADNAINFLTTYDDKKPFYLYLAFHAPHDPRQAPKKYRDMYPLESIDLPPSYLPQHPFDNGHLVLRDEALGPWPRTPEVAREHLAAYYAIITHLDAQIDRVIRTLKANGQYENTLIILAGDSGLGVGCHGLLGKQNVYDEDGVHVPFIISGGQAPQHGTRLHALSYIHDIFPTVCDLVNIDKPESVSGLSLGPVIRGEKAQVRDYTYHAYRQHQRAYRKGDYKLIEFVRAKDLDRTKETFVSGSRVTKLFNFKKDPWETTDLSFLPEYTELVKEMRKEMREKAIELGDDNETTKEPFNFWDFY